MLSSKQVLHIARKIEKHADQFHEFDANHLINMVSEEFHDFGTADDRRDFDEYLKDVLETLQDEQEWDFVLVDHLKEIGDAIVAARHIWYTTLKNNLKKIQIKR
jgi:predicted O-methyltransferase YrrM